MIEWVELVNFQKWDHLKINFSEGINIFSGRSAVGKSAVIRAIMWCIFNKTDHAEIRKYRVDAFGNVEKDNKGKILFTKETVVRIGVDGHIVERYCSSTKNIYKLDDEVFTAFGKSVPTPIKNLFNISEISLQEQFDSLFMVADSSGNSIAKTLNSLASLDIMDNLLQTVNQDIKYNEKEISACEKELSDLETALRKYDSAKGLLETGVSLSKDYDEYIQSNKSKIELENILQNYSETNSLLKKFTVFDSNKLVSVKNLFEEYCTQVQEKDKISKICTFLEAHSEMGASPELSSLKELVQDYLELLKNIESLDSTIQKYTEISNAIKSVSEKMEVCKKDLSVFKVCPLCGNTLGDCND